jgi:hypothetical protein
VSYRALAHLASLQRRNAQRAIVEVVAAADRVLDRLR